MKAATYYAALLALVLGVGCGKKDVEKAASKEPELRSEKVVTPDEAANELFVEAVEVVSEAQSKDATDINASVKGYEAALVKVREITNKHKKSGLAVKLVSDEVLLKGKSIAQIEERVDELQRRFEFKPKAMVIKIKEVPIVKPRNNAIGPVPPIEEILKNMREEVMHRYLVDAVIREAANKPTGELTKADLEKVTRLDLGGKKLTELPKELENLTQLMELYFHNNQLTSVKGLENLTQLKDLFLEDNKLSDVKGLENLTQLTHLYLENNPDLTLAQIADLQKALPKCDIFSNPTK